MLYLDASALVKLAVEERESEQLRVYLREHSQQPRFSSMLVHAEVLRAVRPIGADSVVKARQSLASCFLVDVSRSILERAAMLDAASPLRTLDAIHMVTASAAEDRLTAVVTYDLRMARAANAMGYPVAAPGT
ncbi:MAG: type II toxin-antitoxin system VapC family toxin [Trueperaceae bacterium]|nr:type II toxin-antitoxin system VapC family toxin [Trueperaceae bacterium]